MLIDFKLNMELVDCLHSNFVSCADLIEKDISRITYIFWRYIEIDPDNCWDNVVHIRFNSKFPDNGKWVVIDEGIRNQIFSELRLLYRDVNFKYDTLGGYFRDIESQRSKFEGGKNDFDIIYQKCKIIRQMYYQNYSGNIITSNLKIFFKTVELKG